VQQTDAGERYWIAFAAIRVRRGPDLLAALIVVQLTA
jgi:hypothetical protein